MRDIRSRRDGAILAWGRKRRVPHAALVRIITQRDRGCRHPGCGRTRYLHIHHVRAWSAGGRTDPDNLILLCSTHHRALHRGEFSITALALQQFSFHRPDGTLIAPAPPVTAPTSWTPDPTISTTATVPTAGGHLDLAYTTEVLTAIWAWKTKRQSTRQAA
ncbi:HNH endonuclease signature motif containing protein [Gordonia soli]|uniref:HNH nuclease domain-containing protein n=1 Tax=Gordonia soli NBRC 108243 TaxID=1223545 RepID=M0QG54_9ACTN|nr:hypothetical protein GS4_07_00350 [Gordonia soli NBRC 108243]